MEKNLLLLILKIAFRENWHFDDVKLLNSVSKSLVGFQTNSLKSSYEKNIVMIFYT